LVAEGDWVRASLRAHLTPPTKPATTVASHARRRCRTGSPRLRPAGPVFPAADRRAGQAQPSRDRGGTLPVLRGLPDLANPHRRLGRVSRSDQRGPELRVHLSDLQGCHAGPRALQRGRHRHRHDTAYASHRPAAGDPVSEVRVPRAGAAGRAAAGAAGASAVRGGSGVATRAGNIWPASFGGSPCR
jgi:hypothetical protein